jgi:hypothetical protein
MAHGGADAQGGDEPVISSGGCPAHELRAIEQWRIG